MDLGLPTKIDKCEVHGEYVSHCIHRIWTKCPTCAEGAIAKSDAECIERRAEEARESDKREWERKLGTAGIPPRFQDRTLDSFQVTDPKQNVALRMATEYAKNFDQKLKKGTSAVFVGPPGTGKTHLACGIGLEIMRRYGRTVLFSTVMRAVRRVKDTWRKERSESESDAIDAMIFPDLLILDEVGVQFGSEAEKLILFDILNGRYEQRKPSILMSNFTTEEVRAYLGERIFDRLREDGGLVVVFDWESARGRI